MLRVLVAVLAVSIEIWCSPAALALPGALPMDYGENDTGGGPALPTAGASASGQTVEVEVSTSGSMVGGGSFGSAQPRSVPLVCWYTRWWSGDQYFRYWDSGDAEAVLSQMPEAYRYDPFLGYEAHKGDVAGFWYTPMCGGDASNEYAVAYVNSHPPVYWTPTEGTAEPSARDVDPRLLAEVAYEFTDLPAGTIDWNPRMGGVDATIVNFDTWVWVEGAPTTASVRASIPSGTWAQVDAVLDKVVLEAPGAETVECEDPGVPWTTGATSTSCSIWFTHSSAKQPVKAGQSLPTSTLTVTAVWEVSWTSSLDSTPTDLPDLPITQEVEIPVAEIQALVTLD